ncbi:hypothetical protein PPERSA_01100 [Pseudocohnilembus persalinus]|uniref:PPPDE domain-containing protein n=1 Tax=Pseudocohnilembus persalinus TaxID=266149 RepID=A0A0V0QV43_PSEPJ|nr:hypothetical protein PPERSA_01100 [Pseudocohnilembus persalinus]|eukprot:KRX06022.1 hypothetical protein PPERSA_01100 [Pseudocohnilembus persalinus]
MTEIYLNIYDLSPVNYYLYQTGVGLYHTGLQIGYTEYSYGYHPGSTTGVQQQTPKECPEGVKFRESLLLGKTNKSKRELDAILDDLSQQFIGNQYDLLKQNCNAFTNAASLRIFGKPIPGFVNRMAYLGGFFRCCIPSSVFGQNGGDPMDPMSQQQQGQSFESQMGFGTNKKLQNKFQGKGTSLGGSVKTNPYNHVPEEQYL